MKIIVQSLERKQTDNITDFTSDNRKLSDVAFDFQNIKLKHLDAEHPKDFEIVINVFYNSNYEIAWNFKNPSTIPTAIKLNIIDLLSK
jgi:hypothetical protein